MGYVLRLGGAVALAVVLVVLPMLSGCATGPGGFTQESRVGPDDGTDSCHAEAVALDNTGNFFGQDILQGAVLGAAGGAIIGGLASGTLKGALIGAAAGGAVGAAGGYWEALQRQSQNTAQLEATVTQNLTQENAQINATQIAFNNDMDCRFQQAAQIRAEYKAGTITEDQAIAQMAQVKTLAQRDLQLAQTINGQIQSRGAEFDTATANLSGAPAPGATREALSKPAIVKVATPLLLRPDADAPVIGQLARREDVTVTGVADGYALVQADDGSSGYARLSALRQPNSYRSIYVPPSEQMPPSVAETQESSSNSAYVPPSSSSNSAYVPPAEHTPSASTGAYTPAAPSSTATASAPPASTATVQQLDGSNAASRDAFAQNVAVTQSAVSSGFQLSA